MVGYRLLVIARPVYTKQAKAFLNEKWLIITHKYRILSSHLVSDSKGEASNSVESSKLLWKVAHRHRIPSLQFFNIVTNVGKQILSYMLFLVPGTLCPLRAWHRCRCCWALPPWTRTPSPSSWSTAASWCSARWRWGRPRRGGRWRPGWQHWCWFLSVSPRSRKRPSPWSYVMN